MLVVLKIFICILTLIQISNKIIANIFFYFIGPGLPGVRAPLAGPSIPGGGQGRGRGVPPGPGARGPPPPPRDNVAPAPRNHHRKTGIISYFFMLCIV